MSGGKSLPGFNYMLGLTEVPVFDALASHPQCAGLGTSCSPATQVCVAHILPGSFRPPPQGFWIQLHITDTSLLTRRESPDLWMVFGLLEALPVGAARLHADPVVANRGWGRPQHPPPPSLEPAVTVACAPNLGCYHPANVKPRGANLCDSRTRASFSC